MEFPPWLQGQWQSIDVDKGQMVFRDQSSFKTFNMNLLNQPSEDKYIVSRRSQCGEKTFACIWIRKLDNNILEFQIGAESTEKLTSNVFCNAAENFDNSRWLTQSSELKNSPYKTVRDNRYFKLLLGVGKDVTKTSCPISGKYTGRLPDDLSLCSVLKSECESDVMHFQIGPCESEDIYEKRIYKCLGNWRDEQTTYTFTKRIDVVNTYECFVGLMAGSENEIILREAGENCFKMLDPSNYGMQLDKTGKWKILPPSSLSSNISFFLELCRNGSAQDEKVIVQPTQHDNSIKYETVFDGSDNNIDFNAAVTSTESSKPAKSKASAVETKTLTHSGIFISPKCSDGKASREEKPQQYLL